MSKTSIYAAAVVWLMVVAQPLAQQAAPAWQPPAPTPGAISPQPAGYKQDAVEFTLAPNEGMEYKYEFRRGAEPKKMF